MKIISKVKEQYDKLDSTSKVFVNILFGFFSLFVFGSVLFYVAPASARGICGFISLFVSIELTGSWLYKLLALTIFYGSIGVGLWYFLRFANKIINTLDDDDDDLDKYLGN